MSTDTLTSEWLKEHIGHPESRSFDNYLEAVWVGTAATESGYARYLERNNEYNARLTDICTSAGVDPATAHTSKPSCGHSAYVAHFVLPGGTAVPPALTPLSDSDPLVCRANPDSPEGRELARRLSALKKSELALTCDLANAVDPAVAVDVFRSEDGRDYLMWPNVTQDPDATRPVLTLRCTPEDDCDPFTPNPDLWTRVPLDLFLPLVELHRI